MPKPRVYVETSIPSWYCQTRTDMASVVRKNWTQHWWDFKREGYEIFTSEIVVEELERGDYPSKQDARSLIERIPLLSVDAAVPEIVRTYLRHFLMPAAPTGDAFHLALASYHRCDFLLTWNCEHLANENKMTHIRRTNALMGLWTPDLVTPLNLLGG